MGIVFILYFFFFLCFWKWDFINRSFCGISHYILSFILHEFYQPVTCGKYFTFQNHFVILKCLPWNKCRIIILYYFSKSICIVNFSEHKGFALPCNKHRIFFMVASLFWITCVESCYKQKVRDSKCTCWSIYTT